MDGRDTPPQSGIGFIRDLEQQIHNIGIGRIASISGRYYAMDRDKRWERIDRAFGAIVRGDCLKTSDPGAAVIQSYEHGVTDEFMEPMSIFSGDEPTGLIRDEDACIFFNYRADRAREMSFALTDLTLGLPSRSAAPRNLHFTTMTQYDKSFAFPCVIRPEHPNHILANVFAEANLKNLRVAETEKYAHVTYFFNGGKEECYSGESREMIPSPKVATYDLKPEMSAAGVTAAVVRAIDSASFDVIVMNFANADMVGHSGRMGPTVEAVEAVDGCLGEIYKALQRRNGAWVISADHGNAETMIDPVTHGPHTYHTTNPVPFIVVTDTPENALRRNGSLRDIAPTILGLLGLKQPTDMTGSDLRIALPPQTT
jgi:2,3-bisphosphoglycerate-independent phosphoglycerate mutase